MTIIIVTYYISIAQYVSCAYTIYIYYIGDNNGKQVTFKIHCLN